MPSTGGMATPNRMRGRRMRRSPESSCGRHVLTGRNGLAAHRVRDAAPAATPATPPPPGPAPARHTLPPGRPEPPAVPKRPGFLPSQVRALALPSVLSAAPPPFLFIYLFLKKIIILLSNYSCLHFLPTTAPLLQPNPSPFFSFIFQLAHSDSAFRSRGTCLYPQGKNSWAETDRVPALSLCSPCGSPVIAPVTLM